MFLKPFRVKSRNFIKGSDRKKLRNDVSQQFKSFSEDELKILIPNKDEMEVMKIFCHSGQVGNVYFVEKCPTFFEIEKVLYPTVYTLWKYSTSLPVLTTWPPVFEKLKKGAELMLPGVIPTKQFQSYVDDNLCKGTVCAVCLRGNKSPIAVGVTLMSAKEMIESGMKGKGVKIIHILEDHLWEEGDKNEPPLVADSTDDIMEEFVGKIKENEASISPTPSNESCELDDNDLDLSALRNELNEIIELNDDNKYVTEDVEVCSPESMNQLLEWCLLCALKYQINKSDIPISTSDFYTRFMKPCCPESKILDIKLSTYKKLSKFLQYYSSKGIIKIKELSKGVDSIIEINKTHSEYRSFEVESSLIEDIQNRLILKESPDVVIHEPPKIREMMVMTGNILPFFKTVGYAKGSFLSAHDLKKSITEYVKDNNLQDQNDKRLVTLDIVLANTVLSKGEYMEKILWPLLMTRLQEKLQSAYEISFPNKAPELKKGKLPQITMNIVTRSGSKKVTLIDNLEAFGVDSSKFAHEIQLALSVSTSVQNLPGNNKGLQVTIQGNQVGYVTKLLTETYQLPKKYLLGVEKAVKKR